MSIEAKHYLLRGAVALGAIAGAGRAVSEVNANSQQDSYLQGIHRGLDLRETSQFKVVCIDPANDQRPRKVDILQVRKAETEKDLVYEFTLNGSVGSHLGPDIGVGVGYADKNGFVSTIATARGAAKTADTEVQVERLSKPVMLEQGPATPLKVEEIIFEGGSELITVSKDRTKVTFRIPKVAIAGVPQNEIYRTTEGAAHGDRTTKVDNKDICEPKNVAPPQAKPPDQELPPAVIQPPQPEIPKEFPETGVEPEKQSSNVKDGILIASGISIMTGAAAFTSRRFRKNR